MLKNLMNKKSKSKGFTLIELIIVIAIIAILAAVAVPKYLEVKEKSVVKTDVSNAKVIYDSIVSLISDEKISGADVGPTEIKPSSSAADTTPSDTDKESKDVDKIVAQIDSKNLVLKNKNHKDDHFFYQISGGDVTILDAKDGGVQIYPDANKEDNLYSTKYEGSYRNPEKKTK